MNNILTGPNSRMAIASIDLSDTGITADQVAIIYEAEGNYKSWMPNRDLNAFDALVEGKGYIVIALENLDLTAFFGLEEFVIAQGTPGDPGAPGAAGAQGAAGVGVPVGGTSGQVLAKINATNYNTQWVNQTGGGGGGGNELAWINVKDSAYGAIGDGIVNDAVAIQAAADDIPETGGVLYFPPGKYLVGAASITLDNPTTVLGCGGNISQNDTIYPDVPTPNAITTIISNSTTLDLFIVNAAGCTFEKVGLWNNQTTPTAGHGILLNKFQVGKIDKCSIFGFYKNCEIVEGYLWSITNTFFYGAVNANLVIADTTQVDAGDASIVGCWFYTFGHECDHLIYYSGGGLKISSCKFNSGGSDPRHCIYCPINGSTIILIVIGCSFENHYGHGIAIIPDNAHHFGNVHILGNEFAPSAGHPNIGNSITLGLTDGGGVGNVIVDHNILQTQAKGVTVGGVGTGYNIWSVAANLNLGTGNLFGVSGFSNYDNLYLGGQTLMELKNMVTQVAPAVLPTQTQLDASFSKAFSINLNQDIKIQAPNINRGTYILVKLQQNNTGGWKVGIDNVYWTGRRTINKAPNGITLLKWYNYNDGVIEILDYNYMGEFTTAQKAALITSPPYENNPPFEGSTCYDLDLHKMCVFTGSAWETITSV